MKTISSRGNPLYKNLVKLSDSSKQRRKNSLALLEGARLVSACCEKTGLPEHLIVSESALNGREMRRFLKKFAGVELVVLSDSLFREISELETPAGVMALVRIPSATPLPSQSGFCALLEGVQNPGNLGSILRSAAAAGVKEVFLSNDCADPWSPKVLRAAMGAHFQLRIHQRADLARIAKGFKGRVIATSPQAKASLYQADLTGPIAFIIGNEGSGVSEALLGMASEQVRIPMPGAAESLNAASAAAVCFFEKVRQSGARG